mmetsp:Transcript_2057/g.3585  ORF Transcript_2057/g.3585 Transcript_2057/m.3585 type:complete len:212 (-) Transcript_2057:783-1418(-)
MQPYRIVGAIRHQPRVVELYRTDVGRESPDPEQRLARPQVPTANGAIPTSTQDLGLVHLQADHLAPMPGKLMQPRAPVFHVPAAQESILRPGHQQVLLELLVMQHLDARDRGGMAGEAEHQTWQLLGRFGVGPYRDAPIAEARNDVARSGVQAGHRRAHRDTVHHTPIAAVPHYDVAVHGAGDDALLWQKLAVGDGGAVPTQHHRILWCPS